ncbi:MAG: hypothetical protein ACLR0U_18465 [Enterocloster clostridioformis]
MERISGKGRVVISREKERGLVTKAIEELHIRCFGPGHECVNLSGGNQQRGGIRKMDLHRTQNTDSG